MLRLNGVALWNLTDLKREFSPVELYEKRSEFLLFARVHCMVLSSRLIDSDNDTYEAYYLTKAFWYGVLNDCDKYCSDNSESELWRHLEKSIGDKYSDAEAVEGIKTEIEKELSDAEIHEKLAYVEEQLKALELKETSAVCVLAICEISEIDARSCDYKSTAKNADDAPCVQEGISCLDSDMLDGAEILSVSFKASKQAFRYRKYDSASLSSGSRISTVCIEALQGVNKYDNVMLELYNGDDKLESTVTLRPGEHRYVTVADGRIIDFLPAVNIEDGLCVYRKGYGSKNTVISAKNKQDRTVAKHEPSAFVSLGQNNGALFVCGGKLITEYCTVETDYRTRLMLEMILSELKVIEMINSGQNVKVLTEEGKVYSILARNGDRYSWSRISLKAPEKDGCISLLGEKHKCLDPTSNGDAIEKAISSDNRQSALLMRNGECRISF
ncbi:MAG: hypothetical protein IKM27_07710 [Clostridia bacterium]|nr:hypothetical protein [Clostridia bacterium]